MSGPYPDGDLARSDVAGSGYAVWPQRVIAAVLDDAILAGATWLALGTGFVQPTLTPSFMPDGDGWPGSPLVLVPIGVLVLLLVMQGATGWTPGKLVVGIRLVSERSSRPAGVWTVFARCALHLLDAVLLIGYLRPVWHPMRQTFADSIVRTVVVPAIPDLPRRTGTRCPGRGTSARAGQRVRRPPRRTTPGRSRRPATSTTPWSRSRSPTPRSPDWGLAFWSTCG
ncbi:RDD family protein [Myceligenerans pegani]|uniref:RDD family protein n=1 Tax=Myceligenerans pegani TaxID=2776917 RepID=A0ABR9N4N3_9MICO|nr:RDD family protein [Myceligenerans sp. TRM 65318]MBE1877942.1 RDD family protein [Myceligenerans sp. TRM 65318]MBE3020213.1 RDD family protein [Myceligenerans sp. TRM 65318]